MNQAGLSQIRHRMEQIKNYTSVSADVYVHDVEPLLDLVTPRLPDKPPEDNSSVIIYSRSWGYNLSHYKNCKWLGWGSFAMAYYDVVAWWPLPPVGELIKSETEPEETK